MYNIYLDTFIIVADLGSFTKASEKLYISVPSVMNQINSLEKSLNVNLFYRTHQGVRLSDEGRIIYSYAKKIKNLSNQALIEANAVNNIIRIGLTILNPTQSFPNVWLRFTEEYPKQKFQMITDNDLHTEVTSLFSSLGIDVDLLFGICDFYENQDICDYIVTDYFTISCLVPLNHPLANKRELDIDDIKEYPIILPKKGIYQSVDQFHNQLKKNNNKINIIETTSFYTVQTLNSIIKNNNEILFSLSCWNDVYPYMKNIPIKFDKKIPYGIIYSKHPSKIVNNVIDILKKY